MGNQEILCEENNTVCSFGIITNGYLLSDDVVGRLKAAEIHDLQITLDGAQKSHDKKRRVNNKEGTYDRIIENIRKLPDSFQVTLRINVDKKNIDTMDRLLDDLEKAGIKERVLLNLGRIDDVGTYGTHMPTIPNCLGMDIFSSVEIEFCKKATERGFQAPLPFLPIAMYCGAAILDAFLVLPDGSLQKCFAHLGSGTENFSNIKNPELFHERNLLWAKEDPFQNAMCMACKVLPLCEGGCLIEQKMNKNEPVCVNWKYQIDPFFENMEIPTVSDAQEEDLHWIFEPKGSGGDERGCFAIRCGCFGSPCGSFKFPCQVHF